MWPFDVWVERDSSGRPVVLSVANAGQEPWHGTGRCRLELSVAAESPSEAADIAREMFRSRHLGAFVPLA